MLAPVRPRMQAAGLQCLKLEIAVAFPDPQTHAFPGMQVSRKTRSPKSSRDPLSDANRKDIHRQTQATGTQLVNKAFVRGFLTPICRCGGMVSSLNCYVRATFGAYPCCVYASVVLFKQCVAPIAMQLMARCAASIVVC